MQCSEMMDFYLIIELLTKFIAELNSYKITKIKYDISRAGKCSAKKDLNNSLKY